MKPNILVFLSSVRPNRMATRMSKFVHNAVEEAGMKSIIVDPLQLKVEVVREPLHFIDPTKAPSWMKDINGQIEKADGFIVVSTEYNSTIPPPLTNLMDHFPPKSYRHRPVGIVTYAMSHLGGIRAGVALRPFVSELGLLALPTYVAVPMVHENMSEDGKPKLDINAQAMKNLAKEMSWYVSALNNQKKLQPPPT